MHIDTLSGIHVHVKGTQYVQTLSLDVFPFLIITRLLNLRGVNLLFIFKCLYTCLYRMKIDKKSLLYFNKCCTNDSMKIAAISIVNLPVNGSVESWSRMSYCVLDWKSNSLFLFFFF